MRSEYFQTLLFLRSEKFDVYKLDFDQHAFLSKWYAVAIYEFLDTKNNCHSAKLIADKIKGGVTEEDVKESLSLLKRLGLIKKDSSKGYVKVNSSL